VIGGDFNGELATDDFDNLVSGGLVPVIFRRFQSQPVERVVALINPILRGWVRYFAIGDASRCFGFVKDWVERKVRRHLMRARGLRGFGWDRWRRRWLYDHLGLDGYRVSRPPKALPTG
jgi:RNA-directed DNA polymerase